MNPTQRTTKMRHLPLLLGPAVLACALTGCHTTPTTQPDEGTVATRTTSSLINEGGPVFNQGGGSTGGDILSHNGGSLINEGGPVFDQPPAADEFQLEGQITTPRYYTGAVQDLAVSSERLDGVDFPDVAASAVQPDGSFKMRGKATGKYFFASASFTFEDTPHTIRALAKADNTGSKLVLDTASTLLAAKIALAEQKRHLYTIDFQETTDLTNLVRGRIGDKLDNVRLDVADTELSDALNLLDSANADLSARILRWEFTLDPTLQGTPAPMALPTANATARPLDPTPSPSASESPASNPLNGK